MKKTYCSEHQPHSGARISRYRCFLPDLAGFTAYRRGGANTRYNKFLKCLLLDVYPREKYTPEREGFEPSIRYERIHAFQACSFNRSDISPTRGVRLNQNSCFRNCFVRFCVHFILIPNRTPNEQHSKQIKNDLHAIWIFLIANQNK